MDHAAKEAVPALIQVLREAASALEEIGPVTKNVASALSQALKDEKLEVNFKLLLNPLSRSAGVQGGSYEILIIILYPPHCSHF